MSLTRSMYEFPTLYVGRVKGIYHVDPFAVDLSIALDANRQSARVISFS